MAHFLRFGPILGIADADGHPERVKLPVNPLLAQAVAIFAAFDEKFEFFQCHV